MTEEAILKVQKNSSRQYFLKGVKDCIPTIFGYLSIGFACGVLSKSCGMSFWQVIGMSSLIYGGSSQFIAANMICVATPAMSVISTVFLVNLRHLLMSAAMAPYFEGGSLLKNLGIGILLTDETFGVASPEGMKNKKINDAWMMGLNITAYLNWIVATGVGVLAGKFIPDYKALGLDFALTAMFIGLFMSSVKESKKIYKALIVAGVSAIILIVATYFVGVSWSIMIAAIGGALVGGIMEDE